MCYRHPNGQYSLLKYPDTFCGSDEHGAMLGVGIASRRTTCFISPNSSLLGVQNPFLIRPFCHCSCPPFSAGHAAFLFICLPASQLISLLLSPRFGACTAGVRPFPLATQHFFSFVSGVISLLFSNQVTVRGSQCFLRVSALLRDSVSAFRRGLSPFVSLLFGHCVRLVSLVSPFVSGLASLLVGHCVCLVSCLPSCWSLCPPCLPPVSLCLRSCSRSCWSLRPACPFCLRLFLFLSP